MQLTYPSGVLAVGQFENTLLEGIWNNLNESFLALDAIANICESWLKVKADIGVVKLSIIFSGSGCFEDLQPSTS